MKKLLVVMVVVLMVLALSAPVFAQGIGPGGMPGAHGADNMRCASVLKGDIPGHLGIW